MSGAAGELGPVRATLRALPALLRIGVSEVVAYRAEFFVWMLTTSLPLVMLALWSQVAAEAPFRGYASADFVAYYLAVLVARNITGSWVSWHLEDEVRRGVLSMRLLRPIHPFFTFGATHLATVPLRGLVAMPVAVVLLLSSGASALARDPAQLVWLVPALALGWLVSFGILFCIGSLSFFLDRSSALVDVYFGVFAVFSGYLVPLALLPSWLGAVAAVSPFRAIIAIPVQLVTDPSLGFWGAARLVGFQALWAAAVLLLMSWLWRRGVRRFEAFGA